MSVLLLLLAATAASAQTFEVAGSTTAHLAADAVYVIKGAPAGYTPNLALSQNADVAVVEAKDDGDGSWKWTILPLSTGTVHFTPTYSNSSGGDDKSARIPVHVTELPLGKDAEILDLKPLMRARPPLWPFLLAGALAWLAWYAYKRWKNRPGALPFQAPAPPVPPERAAEEALAALLASGRWESDKAGFYLELTGVLRAYLEARWGEPATAMTSAEVARLVKKRGDDLKIASAVRELLGRADMVKFARVQPGAADGPKDVELALTVIRATTPRDLLKRERELAS